MALPVRQPVGRPISDEERRKKPLSHLLHYGIKMMVRRDIGGSTEIENHADIIAKQLIGKTAAQAGEFVAAMQEQQKEGIKNRQKRTVDEIERRAGYLSTSSVKAAQTAKDGNYEAAYKLCQHSISEMLGGEGSKTTEDITADTHILS